MKEWRCVLVGHHDNVGKTIEELEKEGWLLTPTRQWETSAWHLLSSIITCCSLEEISCKE